MTPKKITFISNITPSTSYGLNLFWALENVINNINCYSEKNVPNNILSNFTPNSIVPIWEKSYKYIFQILSNIKKDKPNIVHIQHEINIYGSLVSAMLFPLLIILIRLQRIKVVVTVHALPKLNQIDKDFVETFKHKSKFSPFVLKILFFFYYKFISILANKIIVHTNLISDIYSSNYKASKKKIKVVPIGCHDLTNYKQNPQPYFFYMGYLVNRKGLQSVIDGFADFIKNNPNNPFELKIAGSAIKGQEFARNEILEIINYYDDEIKNKIHILGFIKQDQVDEYYKNAYAVVVPSKINIAASGPLSWSFSYGKCIIASNIGNLKEDIENEVDGILIDNNYKSWSDAFYRVVTDYNLVLKLQENAGKKAIKRNWINVAKMHHEIYNSL